MAIARPGTRRRKAARRSAAILAAGAAAIVLAAAAAGCGGHAPTARGPGAAGADARNCLPRAGDPAPGSAFTVALDRPVDPLHAPVPRNAAEAVVFRLLYETLTRVDCTGAVAPGLATDWHASPDGLVWTFRLRRDVRLARADRDDVLLLDAATVREAWRDSRRRLLDGGALPWPWERVLLRDVRAVAADRLEVETAAPEPDLPALLSRPEFAVAARGAADDPGDWPRGTRGVIADGAAGPPGAPGSPARELVWWPESKDDNASVARITFRVRPGADARDLADADLVLVGDRAALAYFESREDLEPGARLTGDRLLLLTRHPDVAAAVTGDVRRDLAARATAAIAIPAGGDGIRGDGAGGDEPDGAPAGSAPGRRFLFDDADAAAGDVARRLAATFPGGDAVAQGLTPGAFAARLRRGDGDAFVARIPTAPSSGLEPVQLGCVAPWVAGGHAVPLLEPVTVLVARPGLAGIAAGRDGVPRLEHAGWLRGSRP